MKQLERGTVVWVDFDPTEGSEIKKRRPAVVVSNSVACRCDAVIQVVPLTGLPKRSLRPYESLVASPVSGLAKRSRALANQIRTVARTRLGGILGSLDDEESDALDRALRIQLKL